MRIRSLEWLTFPLRRRALVLAVLAGITLVAGFFAAQTRFDSSIEIWFLEDDPDLVTYDRFLERFDAEEVTVLGVFADDVFAPKNLAALDRITRAAEQAPYAERVTSLTNVRIPRAEGDAVDVGPLVDPVPRTPHQAARIRARALASPLVAGGLVSEDGRAAAVVVELAREGTDFTGKMALVDALKEIEAREEGEDLRILMAGTPVFDAAFYRYSNRDFAVFGPVAFLLVVAACFLVYRRFSSALVPVGTVVIAVTWIFGLMAALGIEVNVLSAALACLVLAVGIADSVHILSDYYQELAKGKDPDTAAADSLKQLFVPCLFTSATTCAGMLSLCVSELEPVRQFGWLAAVSVGMAFALSFTFVPAVLPLARPPGAAFAERQRHGLLARALNLLARPGRRGSTAVVAVSAVILLAALLLIPRLDVGSNAMEYFRKGDPVRRQTRVIDEALGGSTNVEFLVRAPDQGLKDPENLRRLDAFERWLEGHEGVSQSLSFVDSLKELNRAMHDGDADAFAVPDSRALVAQYSLLLEGEELFDAYVQDDLSVGRITTRVHLSEADELVHLLPRIRGKIQEDFPGEDLRIEMTGLLVLMARMEVYLLESQIRSFLLAFAVVTAMMCLLLRSVRLALFSMIPNLTPILVGLGFMAAVGISLNPGTVMIGSIALGLVVDDSVHFLVRLRRHRAAGDGLAASIRGSILETGRPILITSLVLAAGFLVLTLGSFAPNVHFGGISALVVLLAMVFDLTVLPAALTLIRPRV